MEHKCIWIRSNISKNGECNALLIEVRGMNTLRIHNSITVEAEVNIEYKDRDL